MQATTRSPDVAVVCAVRPSDATVCAGRARSDRPVVHPARHQGGGSETWLYAWEIRPCVAKEREGAVRVRATTASEDMAIYIQR